MNNKQLIENKVELELKNIFGGGSCTSFPTPDQIKSIAPGEDELLSDEDFRCIDAEPRLEVMLEIAKRIAMHYYEGFIMVDSDDLNKKEYQMLSDAGYMWNASGPLSASSITWSPGISSQLEPHIK